MLPPTSRRSSWEKWPQRESPQLQNHLKLSLTTQNRSAVSPAVLRLKTEKPTRRTSGSTQTVTKIHIKRWSSTGCTYICVFLLLQIITGNLLYLFLHRAHFGSHLFVSLHKTWGLVLLPRQSFCLLTGPRFFHRAANRLNFRVLTRRFARQLLGTNAGCPARYVTSLWLSCS